MAVAPAIVCRATAFLIHDNRMLAERAFYCLLFTNITITAFNFAVLPILPTSIFPNAGCLAYVI